MTFDSTSTPSHPFRLAVLRHGRLLNTLTDESFDRLTQLATRNLCVPVALVFLVDEDRELYKGAVGLTESLATSPEGSLAAVFCRQVAASGQPLVIEYAAAHAQVPGHPTGGGVTAFIGIPLVTSEEQVLGTFCVLDSHPRRWSVDEVDSLRALAAEAARELELRQDEIGWEQPRQWVQEHGEYFGALIESALDIITILHADGTIRFINPAVERVLGYEPDTLIGRSVFDFLHPDERAAALRMFAHGMNRPGSSPAIEFRVRHADGSWRTHEARGTNLLDDPGVDGVVLNTRDITDRKQAEATRAVVEAHYRRLVGTSPYGIYVLDLGGRVTEINPAGAEILGRAADNVLGHHFSEIVAPADREVAKDAFERVASGRESGIEIELTMLRPSGEQRLLSITTTAVMEGGAVIGVHGVARDVTEERARETQLRRAERLASVGTLVGGMAHELNNPLTSIRSFAQLMLLDDRPAEDRESLEIIHREADRTVKIVTDLRLLARRAHDDRGSERTYLDLNEVVRGVVRTRYPEAERHRITLEEDLAPVLPPVWADREQMEQVVLNLVANAEQALREHNGERRLTVRTHPGERRVSLTVCDTGPGIAPEHRERIFDPFWTTKEPGEGTGLGLSLVHGIVADHGGEIRLDSAPGQGALFTVDLPHTPSPRTAR